MFFGRVDLVGKGAHGQQISWDIANGKEHIPIAYLVEETKELTGDICGEIIDIDKEAGTFMVELQIGGTAAAVKTFYTTETNMLQNSVDGGINVQAGPFWTRISAEEQFVPQWHGFCALGFEELVMEMAAAARG